MEREASGGKRRAGSVERQHTYHASRQSKIANLKSKIGTRNTQHVSHPPLYALWAFLTVLGLALALRFYRLDAQSLWADEGTSVALAPRSLIQIARDASHDIHPPLYYFLLHYWVQLFGTTEAAVRSLSAIVGTALVAATYALGRRLFNPRLGLTAAFIAALSPFQIYYSQETRMYILATLLGTLSFLALLEYLSSSAHERLRATNDENRVERRGATEYATRKTQHATRSDDWRLTTDDCFQSRPVGPRSVPWLAAYAAVTIALLYTHYFAATLLVAHNLVWAAWLWAEGRWQHRTEWLRWATGQVVIVAAFAPWLWYARQTLQTWPATSAPFSLTFLLGEVWRVFSLGLSVPATFSPLLLGFGLLMVIGFVWAIRRRRDNSALPEPWIILAIYLATPILLAYLASLRRPAYNPKFLLLATPPYYLFLAAGIMAGWKPATRLATRRQVWTALGLGFILLASAWSLRGTYFDPQYARDDYRSLVRYVEAVAGPHDAMLINAPGQVEIVDYYASGLLPEYPLPQHRPPDRREVEAKLARLAAQYRHLYAILWATDESDPQVIVAGWLAQHAYPAGEVWYGNVRLAVYAMPQHTRGETHAAGADFGQRIRLKSYTLYTPSVSAGDVVELSLVWQGLAKLHRRYKVFTHLLDPADHIVGQRDAEPLAGTRPTTTWKPSEVITDRYGLPVMAGTPPGSYSLEVGLYDAATGTRLTVAESDRLLLDTVQVTRPTAFPPLSALSIDHALDENVGSLRLRGWNLSRLGSDRPLDDPVKVGDLLSLVLFWQQGDYLAQDTAPRFQIEMASAGQTVARWAIEPLDGRYPPARWAADEVVRDPHTLIVPASVPAGRQVLRIAPALPDSTAPALTLRTLTVQ